MATKSTPRRLYYKIGAVCKMFEIEPHVLRYWESEFKLLRPVKNKSGQRVYREKDVQLIKTIQRLLYEEGYTIAGANKKLMGDRSIAEQSSLFAEGGKDDSSERLEEIRRELEEVIGWMDGKE